MTIINVWLERERALVAVDTLTCHVDAAGVPMKVGGFDGGAGHSASKLLPLAHLGAVIAVRGSGALLAYAGMLFNLQGCSDLDALIDAGPAVLRQSYAALEALARVQGCSLDGLHQEVILVGWSPAQSRMVGVCWQRAAGHIFSRTDIDGFLLAPAPEWSSSVDLSDACSMTAMMRTQVEHTRLTFPGVPTGGNMVLAEVSPGRIGTRVFALPLARSADVWRPSLVSPT